MSSCFIKWRLVGAALMVFAVMSCQARSSEEAAVRKPAVLVLNESGANSIDFPLVCSFYLREGYQIDYMGAREVLKWERLKKYNMVVVLQPFFATNEKEKPSAEALFTLLDKFMEEGGGVLIATDVEGMSDSAPDISEYTKLLMARFGVSYLRQQALREKNEDFALRFGFFYEQVYFTDNVKPHPVTEEVKGLWYPAIPKGDKWNEGSRGMPAYALFAPEPWNVLVRGSKTAYTTVENVRFQDVACQEAMSKSACDSAPPLFAVRDYKNGRMAIYVMRGKYTWVAGTHRNLEGDEESMQGGVILEKGALGKPSHFRRLLSNTVKWLSAPSLENGKLGGYVQDLSRVNEPVAGPSPITTLDEALMTEWRKASNPDPFPAWRGIIGARTELSGAQGSVAAYAVAAKKAGLQYIVFLETFENMTADKLEELKTQCAKSSDEQLLCIPGLYVKDNRGNHQHYFGMTLVWPGKEFLTEDGKMFDVQARKKSSGLPHISFMLSHVANKNTLGYFGFTKSNISAMWNMKLYNSVGLILYEGGKETEGLKENLESYLEVQNAAANAQPLAIDLLDSPAMLEAAVHQKHLLTYVSAKTLADVPSAIWYNYLWRPAAFISNGPLIVDWNCMNRDYEGHAENYLTPNYLFPVRLHIKSEAGLREIRIRDGLKTYMRIGLNGEKDYVQVFMLNHDKQKNLVLEVRDVDGGVAVSGEQFDRNHMNMHYTCGDRVNGAYGRGPLFFPWVSGEQGFNFSGKGMDSFNLYASPQAVGARTFESSAGKFTNTLVTRPLQELVSEDVTWLSTRCSKMFPVTEKIWGPWGTYGPLVDTTLYDLRIDYLSFRSHFDHADPYIPSLAGVSARGDIAPNISTTTYRFKQDQTLKALPIAGYRFGPYGVIPGNEMVLSICQNEKSQPLSDIFTANNDALSCKRWNALAKEGKTRIEPKGFFAIHGTRSGASTIIFYNVGEIPWLVDFSTGNICLMADVEGREVKAGEEIKISRLSVHGEVPELTGVWRYKKLADYMGLDGAPGYPMKLTRGKQLPVTLGFCDLQSQNGAVEFSMQKPKQNLQWVLPVRVFGMNDHWSAVSYDKTRKLARPIGVYQGIAYARFDPDYSQQTDVAVGHPVVADNTNVVVVVAILGDHKYPARKDGQYFHGGTYSVQVNNPTDKDLKVTLTNSMDLPDFPFKAKTMDIKAGQFIEVKE
ncbi:MAG: hypothetical protein WCS52_13820 [bacterium]